MRSRELVNAMNLLFSRGITVRNQSVFQRGVNDTPEQMIELAKRLSHINVQSYYVYICDLVRGTETFEPRLLPAFESKSVRGITAGYNTPLFVVDAPEVVESVTLTVTSITTGRLESPSTAPSVKEGQFFTYMDPLRSLAPKFRRIGVTPRKQRRW